MARKQTGYSWAEFPFVVGVLGIGALLLVSFFRRDLLSQASAVVTALLGIAFLWAFVRRDVWWAVVPGVGLLSLGSIYLVYCLLAGSIVWMGVLLLGLGAYVIAVIPNDRAWINAFYIPGLLLVLLAIYLSPIVQAWRIALVAAFLLLFVLTLWLDRRDLERIWR